MQNVGNYYSVSLLSKLGKSAQAMRYPDLSVTIELPDYKDAKRFYVEAFGAVESCCLRDPATGRVVHAELMMGSGLLMIVEPNANHERNDARAGAGITLCLKRDDADATALAVERNGGRILRPMKNEFHGHRCGLVEDPFGYRWMIFQQLVELTADELQRRWAEEKM